MTFRRCTRSDSSGKPQTQVTRKYDQASIFAANPVWQLAPVLACLSRLQPGGAYAIVYARANAGDSPGTDPLSGAQPASGRGRHL